MTYFASVKTTPFSPQLILNLTKAYENKGKETHYISLLNNDTKVIKQTVMENDAMYSGHLLHIDLSNQKYKLIVSEDVNPSNRKEKLIYNLLKSFQIMHQAESNWKLSANGIIEIFNFIFKEFDPNATLEKKRNKFQKKQELEQLVMQFNKVVANNDTELITLFCAFIIDFINLRIFDHYNEFVGTILLMLLFKQHGFKIVDFESFFLTIFENEEKYTEAINKSSVNWEIGLPQYHFFTMYIVDVLNHMYSRLEKVCRNFQIDKQYSKEELVEQIVMGFSTHFTKEDIRQYNPFISDSTINRALKSMKEAGVIEPTGKGRSAKWRKIKHSIFDKE
jgi:hypothetical protein